MDSKKIKERLLGVVITAITALVCFYFGSFATNAKVDLIASDLDGHKLNVKENYPKLIELKKVESKIDTIKTALCIMDERTCKIQ